MRIITRARHATLEFLHVASAVLDRSDVGAPTKWRLLLASLGLKFQRGAIFKLLGLAIQGNDRTNTVGIVREVMIFGDYAFKPRRDDPTIIDAGANIGVATLYFKSTWPKAKVYAFEAARENFSLLEKNIARNALEGVVATCGVLGSQSGGTKEVFYNSRKPGGSTSVPAVANAKSTMAYEKSQVPAIKLSDFISGSVDLLKMDIEGGEGEVFAELEESGKLPMIDQIVMEYHWNTLNTGNSLCVLLGRLERAGFSIVIYDNERGAFGRAMKPQQYYHFMIRAFRQEK